jgi:arsenate reductase (thioredoxin)
MMRKRAMLGRSRSGGAGSGGAWPGGETIVEPARDGILFVGRRNAVRSQMAEGFARAFARGGTSVFSAGVEPTALDPEAVRAMREVGIDISGQCAKGIDGIPLARIRLAVTLGADVVWTERPRGLVHCYCPFPEPGGGRTIDDLLELRAVRDQLGSVLREYFRRGPSHAVMRPGARGSRARSAP